MTAARPAHDPVEERLRAALDARARLVGPGRLRPSAPPGARGAAAWSRVRRGASALVALAAIVAGVVLWLGQRHQDAPAPPATTPSVTGPPAPSPVPATATAPAPDAASAVPRPLGTAAQSPR
ncbi:hypothetical protein [Streptomyces sp. NRRL S-340]|uniref:hypothetical protein n=1 Tax=Streptomyces sp. NRRL S-340 TaxID=1463901 RepID=UPI0005628B92|nr:hypothetical protein [Streptomyces sp. NRRL S-340]